MLFILMIGYAPVASSAVLSYLFNWFRDLQLLKQMATLSA